MKKLKKFMAALLVALMALAVIPAGAFAAAGTENNAWTPVGTKTVEDGAVPQTFTYSITNTATQPLGSNTTAPETVKDIDDVSVTVTELKKATTIPFTSISLNGAGYYYFTISENEHDLYSPTTDTVATYYAVVAVDNTGATQIIYSTKEITDFAGIDFNKDGGNTAVTEESNKVPSMTFSNTMNKGQDIKIIKTTTGTASNQSDVFPVSITVAGNTDGAVTFTGYNADGTGTITQTLKNGNGTVTGLYVKHGEAASISSTAISTNATITVQETDPNNYTVTYSGANGSLKGGAYEFTKTSATDVVTITNTKNATTITGFVMHYTPYIALVVVAGVAVALITKRRNHSEF